MSCLLCHTCQGKALGQTVSRVLRSTLLGTSSRRFCGHKVLQASIVQLRGDVDDLQLRAPELSDEEDDGGGEDLDPAHGGGDEGMLGVARKRRGKELQQNARRARAEDGQ